MELLKHCPVCDHEKFIEFIQCKDHFLSQELFTILQCENCGLLFTNPRPEEKELGKYYKSTQYISHSNIKKGILNRIYHFIRSYNYKTKYKIISSFIEKGEILDIGCATGEFLDYFKNHGWKVVGIEPDNDAGNYALNINNIEAYDENKLLEFPDKRFDVITMWHVLEHVSDLNSRMKELYRLLKDDGIVIIAVPNSKSYDAIYYQSFWAGYDVPRHLYHFDKFVIGQLFTKHNFICSKIIPMKFDSYYVSLLSQKYTSNKNNYIKAIFTGLKSNRYANKNENNYSSLIFVLKKKNTSL